MPANSSTSMIPSQKSVIAIPATTKPSVACRTAPRLRRRAHAERHADRRPRASSTAASARSSRAAAGRAASRPGAWLMKSCPKFPCSEPAGPRRGTARAAAGRGPAARGPSRRSPGSRGTRASSAPGRPGPGGSSGTRRCSSRRSPGSPEQQPANDVARARAHGRPPLRVRSIRGTRSRRTRLGQSEVALGDPRRPSRPRPAITASASAVWSFTARARIVAAVRLGAEAQG